MKKLLTHNVFPAGRIRELSTVKAGVVKIKDYGGY
jgi:hypothetical protein